MAYTINLTDGTIFATIADGTINTGSSMILVGKNYAGYGEFLDENFIHLLENSSNTTAPSAPLTGQLWWDKTNNQLKVYSGTAFKIISGATNSASAPSNNVVGDFWWDTVNGQLKVWDGSAFELIGPASTSGEGTSGAVVTTVLDGSSVAHVIVQLYVENVIVGIFSKDPTFTPQTPITGFATISPGLQLSSSVTNATFNGTATDSQKLDGLSSSAFMRSTINTSTTGTLGVLNDSGLTVGLDQDAKISVNTSTSEVALQNVTQDANLALKVNDGGVNTTVMLVDGSTSIVSFPTAATVTGNLSAGNLNTSGNLSAGNVNASGSVNASGNVSGNYILGNGSQLSGLSTGSVSSVGLSTSGAGFLSVTGSPVTSSGTLSLAYSGSALPVTSGGTGSTSLTSGSVLVGAGTSAVSGVAPGTNGNVLTVSGGAWVSQAPSAGSGILRQKIFRYNATYNQSTTSTTPQPFVGLGWTSDTAGSISAPIEITTSGSSRVQITFYSLFQLDSGGIPNSYAIAISLRDASGTQLRAAIPYYSIPDGEYFSPVTITGTTGTLAAATHTFSVFFWSFLGTGTVGLGGAGSVILLEEYAV